MATCCCVSSPSNGYGQQGLSSRPLQSTARFRRLIFASVPSPRNRIIPSHRILVSPDVVGEATGEDDWTASDEDQRIGFQIQVSKVGKRNRRLVRAQVRVHAPLDAVWATLTDYEGLADFIPGLSECRLLDQHHGFARLYQVGEQDLALGLKFNAKGTIDCYEGDMEVLPTDGARRREIAFNMIDGDFKLFQGKWSIEEVDGNIVKGGENSEKQEFQTTLSYLLELEPKLWVPVRLLEGRICSEIKNNLVSIREQAQRIQRLQYE